MFNFVVKDHSVSSEEFTLIKNKTYGFLQTTPQPKPEDLMNYYESEDYISHTNSKRNLFEKVYHFVRKITIKQKFNLILSLNLDGNKLLDVGCGTGHFISFCQNKGFDVIGIEPNVEARSLANKKTNNSVFDVNKLNQLQSNSVDVITLWHVLEHLPNLEESLSNFNRILKPNGILIIAVPNYKSFDATYYKSNWAAYDVPRHLWHFDKSSIKQLLIDFNFNLFKFKPMWFDAFYVSILSEKINSGKSNFIKALTIGFISNFKALFSKEASSLIYVSKKV